MSNLGIPGNRLISELSEEEHQKIVNMLAEAQVSDPFICYKMAVALNVPNPEVLHPYNALSGTDASMNMQKECIRYATMVIVDEKRPNEMPNEFNGWLNGLTQEQKCLFFKRIFFGE